MSDHVLLHLMCAYNNNDHHHHPHHQWDIIEKERVPLSSIAIGAAGVTAVSGYFFQRWWTKRNEKLIVDFVDDMVSHAYHHLSSFAV